MNFCGQMIQTSRLGVRCFVPSTRARTVMLAARALSSNFANPAATRRRVEYFGWPLTTTLRLPTNPHRNGGEHTEELVIGRIGFGSPPLGAASERAANLRAALEAGCNWVELDAPLAANDPRLLSLGDPYGEQFLYGSWQAGVLDRVMSQDGGNNNSMHAAGAGDAADSDLLAMSNALQGGQEASRGYIGGADASSSNGSNRGPTRAEVVLVGRCALPAAADAPPVVASPSSAMSAMGGNASASDWGLETELRQLLEYHQQDALDVVLIDLPHALFNFSEGEGESADYRDLESELVEAAGLLEEARVGGLVGGYGFATSSLDAKSGAALADNLMRLLASKQYPGLVAIGLPAGPLAPPLPTALTSGNDDDGGAGNGSSGDGSGDGASRLFVVGSQVSHGRSSTSGAPLRFIESGPGEMLDKNKNSSGSGSGSGSDSGASDSKSSDKSGSGSESESTQPFRAHSTETNGQTKLENMLNSAIHLEKKYVEHFVEGPSSKSGSTTAADASLSSATGGAGAGGAPSAFEEELLGNGMGSSSSPTTGTGPDATPATYPLPFLPPRSSVSWGHLLAQHHEAQIAPGGAAAWEAARDCTLWPQANFALDALMDQPKTKDWATVYRVVLRGLVSAYDEVHRPGRLTAAANAHAALDASAPTLKSSNKDLAQDGSNNNETSSSSSSSSSSPTLVGKCARVALGRGCEVAITEDWCEGGAASDQLSSSEDSTEEAKSEEVVMNSDLKSNAPHEFTRLQPADLPSLEETMHVSSGFAKHLS